MPVTGNSPTPPGIVLVGARSHRQGTGPFIAAGLQAAGACIQGIVGTSNDTVQQALAGLQADWGIATLGYTDLQAAMEREQPLAVAICSPWRFHAGQLRQVAAAGCHCLVEKPLAWPATEDEAADLIADFSSRGLLLQMVSQWPTTLGAFSDLHGALPAQIERFRMRLSPISIGPDMITDSAPHFISMLQALLGPGNCENVAIEARGEGALDLRCDYRHAAGSCRAELLLQTCEQRPRPAWYAINELRADRAVELPQYQQYLVDGERRVALEDPIQRVAAEFVKALAAGETTDVGRLTRAHRNLLQLAAAWE